MKHSLSEDRDGFFSTAPQLSLGTKACTSQDALFECGKRQDQQHRAFVQSVSFVDQLCLNGPQIPPVSSGRDQQDQHLITSFPEKEYSQQRCAHSGACSQKSESVKNRESLSVAGVSHQRLQRSEHGSGIREAMQCSAWGGETLVYDGEQGRVGQFQPRAVESSKQVCCSQDSFKAQPKSKRTVEYVRLSGDPQNESTEGDRESDALCLSNGNSISPLACFLLKAHKGSPRVEQVLQPVVLQFLSRPKKQAQEEQGEQCLEEAMAAHLDGVHLPSFKQRDFSLTADTKTRLAQELASGNFGHVDEASKERGITPCLHPVQRAVHQEIVIEDPDDFDILDLFFSGDEHESVVSLLEQSFQRGYTVASEEAFAHDLHAVLRLEDQEPLSDEVLLEEKELDREPASEQVKEPKQSQRQEYGKELIEVPLPFSAKDKKQTTQKADAFMDELRAAFDEEQHYLREEQRDGQERLGQSQAQESLESSEELRTAAVARDQTVASESETGKQEGEALVDDESQSFAGGRGYLLQEEESGTDKQQRQRAAVQAQGEFGDLSQEEHEAVSRSQVQKREEPVLDEDGVASSLELNSDQGQLQSQEVFRQSYAVQPSQDLREGQVLCPQGQSEVQPFTACSVIPDDVYLYAELDPATRECLSEQGILTFKGVHLVQFRLRLFPFPQEPVYLQMLDGEKQCVEGVHEQDHVFSFSFRELAPTQYHCRLLYRGYALGAFYRFCVQDALVPLQCSFVDHDKVSADGVLEIKSDVHTEIRLCITPPVTAPLFLRLDGDEESQVQARSEGNDVYCFSFGKLNTKTYDAQVICEQGTAPVLRVKVDPKGLQIMDFDDGWF